MKKQVLVIHGGTTFDTYKEYLSYLKNQKIDLGKYRGERWRYKLGKDLGRGFDVLLPTMPNGGNAEYKEWKIVFKKIAVKLQSNVILIGHSLGAIFLAKFLSENRFPKKIRATFLLAPPYDDKDMDETLGSFRLPKSLKGLERQGGRIFIYHSKDDGSVPFSHSERYLRDLPDATFRKFTNKGHFNQPKFPELVRDIKSLK